MKLGRKALAIGGFALWAGLAATTATAAEAVITHEVPLNHWKHQLMQSFAEEVAVRTEGEVEFRVFPSGQLYSDANAVAALGTGAVQMTWPVTVHLETIHPDTGVINLPFSLTYDQMVDSGFYADLVDLMNGYLLPRGVRLLGFLRSSEGIIALRNREVTSLEDLAGLRVRVVGGRLFQDTISAYDASPVSVPGPELISAISQGVIDAAVTSASGWRDMGGAAPYAALVPGFSLILFAIVVDADWFDSLSEGGRTALQEVVDETVARQWQESMAVDEAVFQERIAGGGRLWRATEEEAARWRERAEGVITGFAAAHPQVFARYREIVEQYESRR